MKIPLLIAATLVHVLGYSQNLVPNPSFEDADSARGNNKFRPPCAWFFQRYSRSSSGAGYIVLPSIPAPTGTRYMNFIIGNHNDNSRTYWQTMLLHTTEKGKKYRVGISISGWNAPPSLNDIGLFLTDSMIFCKSDTLLQPDGYIDFLDAKVKNLKNSWFRLEKEFTATADHQILIIGNFSKKDYQADSRQRYTASPFLCVLMDDIVIAPVEKIPCEDCPRIRDSLYMVSRQRSMTPDPGPADTVQAPAPTVKNIIAEQVHIIDVSDILFATGSYTLKDPTSLDAYKPDLQKQGIRRIVVTGYTDNTGSVTTNQDLSLKRAREVARLLSARLGVPAELITTEGKGISNTYPDKEMNRRVEIAIHR